MLRIFFCCFVLIYLSSCSSLEKKASQLEIGSSINDVAKIMGPAPYNYTHQNVDVWRYAVVAGLGYCDYREFYIYKDVVIYKNEYHYASIAGCTAGLQNIEWEPVFAKVDGYDREHPITMDNSNKRNLVQDLKDLSDMKKSGVLTEEEYGKAKQSLLNK
jgi:hypothetical protein